MLPITVPIFITNKNDQYGTGSILHGPTRLCMRGAERSLLEHLAKAMLPEWCASDCCQEVSG